MPRKLYRLDEALGYLGIGRTRAYEEMSSGRLAFVQNGRTRLVTGEAIDEYVDLIEAEHKDAA